MFKMLLGCVSSSAVCMVLYMAYRQLSTTSSATHFMFDILTVFEHLISEQFCNNIKQSICKSTVNNQNIYIYPQNV